MNINTTTSTPLTPEQRRIAERKARNARDNKKRMETLAKFVQPLAEAVANKNKDLEGQHILAPHGEDEWIPKQMKVEYYHATNTNHPRVKLSMKVYDKSYKRNEKGDHLWDLIDASITFSMGKDIDTWSYYGNRGMDLSYVKMHKSWSKPERPNRYYKNMGNAVKKAIEAMEETFRCYNNIVHHSNQTIDHNESFRKSIRLPEIDGINIRAGFSKSGNIDHQTQRCLEDRDPKQSWNWDTVTRTRLSKYGERKDLTTKFSGFEIKTNSMEAGQARTTQAINDFNNLLDEYKDLIVILKGC